MNIGIIGVGGVGGYFGGKLAKRFENDKDNRIYFLARGEHLNEIKRNGLTLSMNNEIVLKCVPYLASDKTTDFPVLDVCIICVKGYDLKGVLENLKPNITDKTEIIPLLNGVDVPQRIYNVIPNALVYPSCVYVGTHIKSPGYVEQNGGSAKIITGPSYVSNKKTQNKIPKFLKLFDEAHISYEWTSNNYEAIWEKFMLVGSYSIVTAFYDKTLGEVNADPALVSKVRAIGNLLLNIAHKENVNLPDSSPEDAIKKIDTIPFETKTSFQLDFERKNKPIEKETFIDSIVLLAKKHNLDASCVLDIVNKHLI